MSLKVFHFVFILLVILGADLFAAWSVWQWMKVGELSTLLVGITVGLGGLGLIFYAVRLVRRFDAEHIA